MASPPHALDLYRCIKEDSEKYDFRFFYKKCIIGHSLTLKYHPYGSKYTFDYTYISKTWRLTKKSSAIAAKSLILKYWIKRYKKWLDYADTLDFYRHLNHIAKKV